MLKRSNLFSNNTLNKKELKKIIEWAFKNYGQRKAAYFVDELKELGFEYATKSGISISLEDLRIPPDKTTLMQSAYNDIFLTDSQANNGEITEVERFQKIIYIWSTASEELKDRLIEFFKRTDPLNSVYIMAFSGARGNIAQVRQLIGMRGLMSDAKGQIIDKAIGANFREGLSITDYIISSYGARKGIVDTAIKTADSGYLTRRLVEVAQSLIISELDCKTKQCIIVQEELENDENDEEESLSFKELLNSRVLAFSILKPGTDQVIANRNELITPSIIKELIRFKCNKIGIRSPLTCACRRSVCQHCYGGNLASGNLVDLGETVGLIAAQSIGEPGTQLTMRTFHTGGIFTGQLIRQGRAECSGYLHFLPELKLRPYRTKYGQDVVISENRSWLGVINYANELVKFRVELGTLILVPNHTYIRRNQVLFEAVPKLGETNPADEITKYVNVKESGEIIPEKKGFPQDFNIESSAHFNRDNEKSQTFWVLSGQVFRSAFNISFKVRELEKIYQNQAIAQSKMVTLRGGFIHFGRNELTKEVTNVKIQNSYQSINNFKFFLEKNSFEITKCKVYLSHVHDIILKPELLENHLFCLGFFNNKNYKTKTGGEFYISSFYKPTFASNKLNNKIYRKIRAGSTIFYTPKATIETKSNKKDFKFKKGNYVKKNKEIFPNYFINIEGFIDFEIQNQTKLITIKPAQRQFLGNKKKLYEKLHEQVYYPGEIVLNKFEIETLSCLEIENTNDGSFLYIRPITRYEFTNESPIKTFQPKCFTNTNVIVENFNLHVLQGQDIKIDAPVQFIDSPLLLDYSFQGNNTELIFEFKEPDQKNSWGHVNLILSELFDFDKAIPREIKKTDIFLNLIASEKQFVDPYSVIGSFDTLMPFDNFVCKVTRKQNNLKSQILLTTKSDYETIFLDGYLHDCTENQFLKVNKLFHNNGFIRNSGLLKDVSGNRIVLHLGHPYFFSHGAVIRKLPGDYIKKQECFGQLIYQRLKTGDIVQGLPKIDDIFEARNPKREALLAVGNGIIKEIGFDSNRFALVLRPHKNVDPYIGLNSKRLLVKKNQVICVGQPLTVGPLNPHTLLQVYFDYFCSLYTLSTYQAAYISLKKLQNLLLTSVQAIYRSQGVIISCKHVELIVRQMTRKVYVEYPGATNFLPGDIIDLDQAKYINCCIDDSYQSLRYRPILLGITRSSLKTEGFLAAASFQETTRVLTHAAVLGKTDWLQGLKENAITGRLIPAGTGFHANQEITFNKVLLPEKQITKKENLSLKKQLKLKQKKLKKIIKFKYIKNPI